MKREIIFTSDFATKKKGDKEKCDSMLASQLVNNDKVAKYTDEADEKEVVLTGKKPTKKK